MKDGAVRTGRMERALTPEGLEEIYRITEPHCAPGYIDQLRWEAANGGVRRCFGDDAPRESASEEERYASIERSKARKALIDAGCPEALRDLVIDGYGDRGEAYRESDIVCRLRRQLEAEDNRRMLLLYGVPGTGKSAAAAVAMREAGGGIWASATAYAERKMARFRRDWQNAWLRQAESNCGFLVIDDAGEEPDEHASVIEALINARYGQRGVTLLTSNCSKDEFRARYKGRVVSRLVAAGMVLEATERLRPRTGRDEA